MKTRMISMLALVAIVAGSTDAFASRARVNVMGQGDAGFILNSSGSMYYDDMYNIFYNPAYVNDFKNWVIVEKGSATGTNEGGFVTSFMGVNVGAFFNRVDAFNFTSGATATANNSVLRPIDLVVGGDHGVKWGLGLTYAKSKGDAVTAGKQNHLTARAGVMVADFAPFVSYRIKGEDKTNDANKTKANDMTIGVKYQYGEWSPYAAYRTFKHETTAASVTTKDNSLTAMLIGAGRNTKIGENARLVYNLAYARLTAKDIGASASKSARTVIPVDFAIEGDVASWITVRAGLQYRLMDRVAGATNAAIVGGTAAKSGSQADNTGGRIGATFHVSKLDIDWAFGSNSASAGAANLDTDTVGFDSGTFSNLSVSYKW